MLLALILPNSTMSTIESFRGMRLLSTLLSDSRKNAVQGLATEVERYRANTGGYPASLSAMALVSGYEHVKAFVATPSINYDSASLADTTWNFTRALVAGVDLRYSSFSAFESSNTCGSGAFNVATSWCGSSTSGDWYKTETRNFFLTETVQARNRLNQTLLKFVAYFNVNGAFPSASLTAGATGNLATLVSASGNASTCSTQYNLSGIPLGCEDLYSYWGGTVWYGYISATNITLMVKTPFTYASGTYSGSGEYIAVQMQF